MTDTAVDQLVTIELPLSKWKTLTSSASRASEVDSVLREIETRLPLPLPTTLGAVIRAYVRNPEDGKLLDVVLVLADEPAADDLPWRDSTAGDWYRNDQVQCREVLSEGWVH